MLRTGERAATTIAAPASRTVILAACALSGAGVMIVELTATRLFAPWFGASMYSWTNVIAVVLFALSLGYAVGGRIADRRPVPTTLGAILVIAAALLIPAPLLARVLAPALVPDPALTDPASSAPSVVLGSLVATLVLFGPPLVLLGAVAPFATRLLSDRGLHPGQAAGRTLAVSTLGSLVGTYLPALVLLEWVGSRGTIFVAAGTLAVAGLLLLGVRRRSAIASVAGIGVAIAGGGVLTASMPVVAATHGETLVAETESAYQFIRVAKWPGRNGAPDSVNLSLDEGILEFHSRKRDGPLTGAYYDAFAVLPSWIAGSAEQPIDVLVIGGGAGTMRGMLRTLQATRVRRIVDVEIDPRVAGYTDQFGGAPAPSDTVMIADGRVALEALQGPFDLVILDAYARQLAIPPHLATREAFALVRSRLSPRGIFAINVSAADVEAPLPAALVATLRASFPRVWSVAIPGSWNFLLVAGSPVVPKRDATDASGPLAPVHNQFRRGFHELTDIKSGAMLTDDCAPLESLARKIR